MRCTRSLYRLRSSKPRLLPSRHTQKRNSSLSSPAHSKKNMHRRISKFTSCALYSHRSDVNSHNKHQFSTTFHSAMHSSDQDAYHQYSMAHTSNSIPIRSTTIICVRKGDDVVLMGDGQMTMGSVVAKPNARKLRKIGKGNVICGFAGAAADGLALVDLLEKKLSERDELRRACVETSRLWRTDKILRHLNALIIVADEKATYELTGNGELVESDTGIIAIGSGGNFAEAAARALIDGDMTADEIAQKAMKIAGDMCVYTNHNTMKLKLVKGKGLAVEDDAEESK